MARQTRPKRSALSPLVEDSLRLIRVPQPQSSHKRPKPHSPGTTIPLRPTKTFFRRMLDQTRAYNRGQSSTAAYADGAALAEAFADLERRIAKLERKIRDR